MKTVRQLRTDAARIWSAALRAVDPATAIRAHVRRKRHELRVDGRLYDLRKVERIWVIGAGKAAAPMARSLEQILEPYHPRGLLVTKYGHGLPLRHLDLLEAGHPLPDANGVEAGLQVGRLLRTHVQPEDLVFCLLSGGGSALLVTPAPGITLDDKLRCTQLLLRSSATIHEINAVRKHLSSLKGGGLARLLARNTVVSLILSDVVGDDLDTIASGPLVPDSTTFRDCRDIFDRHGIFGKLPACVRKRIEAGTKGKIAETPKRGDPAFRNIQNAIVGNNAAACAQAAREAKKLGFKTLVLTSRLEGDTQEAARFHMAIAQEIVSSAKPIRRPACLLSGGETTVRISGRGKGGRNQEFVLHCVRSLMNLEAPCLVASLGTDGTDGPTDSAGAMADNATLTRSLKFGAGFLAEAIANNDSYHFFERLKDLIVTGPTRTNVMDLHIILIG